MAKLMTHAKFFKKFSTQMKQFFFSSNEKFFDNFSSLLFNGGVRLESWKSGSTLDEGLIRRRRRRRRCCRLHQRRCCRLHQRRRRRCRRYHVHFKILSDQEKSIWHYFPAAESPFILITNVCCSRTETLHLNGHHLRLNKTCLSVT